MAAVRAIAAGLQCGGSEAQAYSILRTGEFCLKAQSPSLPFFERAVRKFGRCGPPGLVNVLLLAQTCLLGVGAYPYFQLDGARAFTGLACCGLRGCAPGPARLRSPPRPRIGLCSKKLSVAQIL